MSETKALAKYGSVDVAAMAKAKEKFDAEQAEKRARAGFLKTDEGKTLIRMMPPWKVGVPGPIKIVWVHKVRPVADPEGAPRATIPCPSKNNGKHCILCKRVRELRATGAKADEEYAYSLSSQERFFAQVVDLAQKDKGIVLWEFGGTVNGPLLGILGDEEKGGDITHPITGRNLIIDRVGKGKKDTRYTVNAVVKSTPIQDEAWLDSLIDLDMLASDLLADKMQEMYDKASFGGGEPEPEDAGASTAQSDARA